MDDRRPLAITSPAALSFFRRIFLKQSILQNSSKCAILYKNNIFIQKVHTMNIIAGAARGVVLNVPPGIPVRPTAGRVRKALFDSLGDLSNEHILDLFSGSGALALESLSRGAISAAMVELSNQHISCIESNIKTVRNTGVDAPISLINADATRPETYLARLKNLPTLIFADPPYPVSAECFAVLMQNAYFNKTLAGAKIYWEIPDTPGAAGEFLKHSKMLDNFNLRRFAGTMFLTGTIKSANRE